MKKLIGLGILGLLLSGCRSSHTATTRRHEIVCQDLISELQTYDVVTFGNVYAFVVKGHSVLAFYVEGDKQIRLIPLLKNDCIVY